LDLPFNLRAPSFMDIENNRELRVFVA